MKLLLLEDIDILEFGNNLTYAGLVLGNGKQVIIVPTPEHLDTLPFLTPEVIITPGAFERVVHQTDLIETQVIDGHGAKILVRKSQRQLDLRVSWEVFHRDHYRCRYCNSGDGTPLTYDHIVLWEKGGPTTVENGVTACKKCNNTRGNTNIGVFLESDYYKLKAENLTEEQKQNNSALIKIAESVELRKSQRKR
jgi:5-methylcytosine-specific restriction endonuclease McrA